MAEVHKNHQKPTEKAPAAPISAPAPKAIEGAEKVRVMLESIKDQDIPAGKVYFGFGNWVVTHADLELIAKGK